MDDFWHSTKALVQTISPIHIGSGDKLTPLSYIYKNKTAIAINEEHLLRWIKGNPALTSEFITLAERGGNLHTFLNNKGLEPEKLALYALETNTPHEPNEILSFIKSMDSLPYLPGSSLKGCLRSALLRGIVVSNPSLADDFAEIVEDCAYSTNRKEHNSISETIQAKVFVNADVNRSKYSNFDLNRALIVGDSVPIDINKFEVAEVRILSVQMNGRLEFKGRNNSPVVVYIETPKLRSTFRLSLRRDLRLLDSNGLAKELNTSDLASLMVNLTGYCRIAGFELIEQEIEFYHRHGRGDLAGWFEGKRDALLSRDDLFILPIGWGSGYDAKTITDQLGYEAYDAVVENYRNTAGLGKPGNSSANPWLGPNESPKSRKVVVREDGTVEPIGWVVIKLDPIGKVSEEWLSLTKENAPPQMPSPQALADRRIFLNQGPESAELIPPGPEITEPVNELQHEKPSRMVFRFTSLPIPGDRFRGLVLTTDDPSGVYVEIPGLSPDDQAMAFIDHKDIHQQLMEDEVIICEVIDVKPDPEQNGLMLVKCILV
ncbi:MAG: type III-A CRISPR-associated RAMP protein Csm5 [Anaerolineaceae bacterium]|nr:type III-A CRISPR-associated RAMP protein Csm5 [Anaerolineaceae bacterium]